MKECRELNISLITEAKLAIVIIQGNSMVAFQLLYARELILTNSKTVGFPNEGTQITLKF